MMQDVRAVAAKGMAPVVKARCGQDEADSWLQLSLHNEKNSNMSKIYSMHGPSKASAGAPPSFLGQSAAQRAVRLQTPCEL